MIGWKVGEGSDIVITSKEVGEGAPPESIKVGSGDAAPCAFKAFNAMMRDEIVSASRKTHRNLIYVCFAFGASHL